MAVLELTDARALTSPALQEFIERAIKKVPLLAPVTNMGLIAQDILNFVTDPDHFMILGIEDGEFKALGMGMFNTSALFPYPLIEVFYNEGSAAVRREVASKMMDIIMSRGYTKALAMNGTTHSDAAWIRRLKAPGARGEVVGSLVMFEVE